MRPITLLQTAAAILLGPVCAFAAETRQDSSGLLVWIFLGFCALIVLLQLAPAVMLAFGLIRGAAEQRPETMETVEVENRD